MKTKGAILSALIAIFMLTSLELKAQYIAFGVYGEPQLSWYRSDTKAFSSNGPVVGFNAGFSLERYFADRYAITTGASIANVGGNIVFNNTGDSIVTLDDVYHVNQGASVKVKGQYISIPLGLKFKTNEIGYTTFYANLGLKANVRLKGFAWIEEMDVDREVLDKAQMQFAYLSYYFGAGVQYSLGGPSSILAGLTFSNGLTHPLKESYKGLNVSTFGLKVGLVF